MRKQVTSDNEWSPTVTPMLHQSYSAALHEYIPCCNNYLRWTSSSPTFHNHFPVSSKRINEDARIEKLDWIHANTHACQAHACPSTESYLEQEINCGQVRQTAMHKFMSGTWMWSQFVEHLSVTNQWWLDRFQMFPAQECRRLLNLVVQHLINRKFIDAAYKCDTRVHEGSNEIGVGEWACILTDQSLRIIHLGAVIA